MKTTTKTTSDLQQFYAELLKDPMLQERLKAATTPENLCELAAELGKERGYAFTKEEALAALQIELALAGDYLEVGESLAPSASDKGGGGGGVCSDNGYSCI